MDISHKIAKQPNIAIATATAAESSQKKLRILVVCHAYVTNVNQGKLDAIAATETAEVALLSPNRWRALGWGRVMKLENPYPRVKLYPANILFSGKVGAYFYFPWQVWQAIKDFQPDVIHVEQEVFSISALEIALFARWFDIPMSVFGWENMSRKLSSLRAWIRQYVFDTAKLIIPGNQDGKDLMHQWGYQGKLEVMPQIGVDTVLFPPQVRQLDKDELVVGFMGRLVYQKGVDLLLEAAKQLHSNGQKIRVIICGAGQEESQLQDLAQKLGITELVTWHSGISHERVPAEMAKFDVLVLPSRTIETWKEQFGHVLIEAMSMGIPVIGSDSGEIPQVIGRADLVFAESDATELASILTKIAGDRSWYRSLSQYSIERVEALYSHERIARRLLSLWQEMI